MPADLPDIPIARRVAHSVTHHGVTIEDPYAWLRDPAYPQVNDPDVLGYLKAENAYFEAAMKPHRALIDTLFAEMKGRVKDDDASVPQKDGAFVYWNAFDPARNIASGTGGRRAEVPEAVIIDEPALAARSRVFPARRPRRQPGWAACSLCRRYQRLRTLLPEGARSRDRR
jgi:oligopeptidase B